MTTIQSPRLDAAFEKRPGSLLEFDLSIFAIAVLIEHRAHSWLLKYICRRRSLITLPALIALGLPADIANATNRLGIFAQSITGAKGFDYYGRLDRGAVLSLAAPIVIWIHSRRSHRIIYACLAA